MWFVANPSAAEPADSLFALNPPSNPGNTAENVKPKIPDAIRKQMLPKRIAWRNTFLADLGGISLDIVDSEEYKRFRSYEDRALAFEKAMLDYTRISRDSEAPGRNIQTVRNNLLAAQAAADLGIYTTYTTPTTASNSRIPYSSHLLARLNEREVLPDVLNAESNRQLRRTTEETIANLIERRPFKSL